MILTDNTIIEELDKGNVIIAPFNPEQLKNTMYDVTLGEHYYSHTPKNFSYADIISPFSKTSMDEYWDTLSSAKLISELPIRTFVERKLKTWCEQHLLPDDRVIILKPQELILCHTQEFIGSAKHTNITTHMNSRSTLGRCCFSFCSCAGLGDIGYYNRWTMEVKNNSNSHAVLVVGARVASITFSYTTGVSKDCYTSRGTYMTDTDVETLMTAWSPQSMLPGCQR